MQTRATNSRHIRIRIPLGSTLIASAMLFALTALSTNPAHAFDYEGRPAAPEFTHNRTQDWINSSPLKLSDLRGQVVLLDIWTYDCWNCYRSFPWLTSLEKRLEGQAFLVVGVHTPEFERERSRENVAQKVAEFELHHPIMLDNDYSFWNALSNRYWPTFYLIDKQGRMVKRFIGETHADSDRAKSIEHAITLLLNE